MLVMDTSTCLVDQYSTSMVANYSAWPSEASAPISFQVADLYQQEDIYTSFTRKKSFTVYINSELFDPKFELHRALDSVLSANDEEYGEAAKPLPFSNRLTSVQDQLSLSITQVAELFGVTRKSVYDWYDDKSMPRAATVNRAEILLDIIKESPLDIDLSRLKTVWNIPTSGRSFLAVLNDESLSVGELKSFALEKIVELSPRLGQATNRSIDMRQGTSHLIDVDRSTDV